jgi:hypothetical protein
MYSESILHDLYSYLPTGKRAEKHGILQVYLPHVRFISLTPRPAMDPDVSTSNTVSSGIPECDSDEYKDSPDVYLKRVNLLITSSQQTFNEVLRIKMKF